MFVLGCQRFNLQFYFPVVILTSIGLLGIYRRIRRKPVVLLVLFMAVILNVTLSFNYVYSKISLSVHYKEYEELFKAGNIDQDCVFITYNPSFVISTLNKSSVLISAMRSKEVYDTYLKDRCLILVDDYWCKKDLRGLCSYVKDKYSLEKVDPDSELLYRLHPKPD